MSNLVAGVTSGVSKRIVKFMEKASLMAMQSPMKFKHGAVLVKFGRTIGSGFNYDRMRFRGKDITSVHAEIQALDGKTLSTASGTFCPLFIVLIHLDASINTLLLDSNLF